MAQLFISYSRSDRLFLDMFLPLIRKVYGNHSLWYDDDIPGGVDWWETICNEISNCKLFVYLVSNESLESSVCQKELRHALSLKKQILPVIVRRLIPTYPGNSPDDLQPILKKTQYVDLTNMQDTTSIAKLYAAINQQIQLETTSMPPSTQSAHVTVPPPKANVESEPQTTTSPPSGAGISAGNMTSTYGDVFINTGTINKGVDSRIKGLEYEIQDLKRLRVNLGKELKEARRIVRVSRNVAQAKQDMGHNFRQLLFPILGIVAIAMVLLANNMILGILIFIGGVIVYIAYQRQLDNKPEISDKNDDVDLIISKIQAVDTEIQLKENEIKQIAMRGN